MDIEIREIQESDYSQVLALWNDELGNRYVTADNIAAHYQRVREDDNYKTFVALLDQRVVGFITTSQIMAVGLPVGYQQINGLAVERAYQHQGIGTQLLQHAERAASQKGVSFMLLNSGFKRTAAHAFYERNGYARDSYCFDKALPAKP